MAGHIVFAELARQQHDARATALVRRVADLGFDADGRMLEAMPHHDRYSDSVFMGTTILAQAGALTGERRYFEMADRHLRFMQRLVLRDDGLYRHRSDADVAWGRGNGFAALGLALTLSELPRQAPGRDHALRSYRELMAALLPRQDRDGLWRNVSSGRRIRGFSATRDRLRRRAGSIGWIADVVQRGSAYAGGRHSASRTGGYRRGRRGQPTTLEQYLRVQRSSEGPRGVRGNALRRTVAEPNVREQSSIAHRSLQSVSLQAGLDEARSPSGAR